MLSAIWSIPLDITVKPITAAGWSLIDLLGRDVGSVIEKASGEFRIEPRVHYLPAQETTS